MRILGIHSGHNATVALLEDGQLSCVLSEEKFNNIKNSAAFPRRAIAAVLAERDLSPDMIDEIAIAGENVFPEIAYDYLFDTPRSRQGMGQTSRLRKSVRSLVNSFPPAQRAWRTYRTRQLLHQGRKELEAHLSAAGFADTSRTHVDHHTCHARAAYHALSAEEGEGRDALVFTADGSGDGISASVTRVGHDGTWDRLSTTPESASLGGIYSAVTRFLGMKILEHEYKVMGLAPYAKNYFHDTYSRVFEGIITRSPHDPLAFTSKLDTHDFHRYLKERAVGERFDNLAAAVQLLIEEQVLGWVSEAMKMTGARHIFTGGGLFMNVKLNMRIQELAALERVDFMPSCGDESNAIGAAYAVAAQNSTQPQPLKSVYLGQEPGEQAIADYLDSMPNRDLYEISRPTRPEAEVANLLAQGEVVARFVGRGEWGARSLGNRAILAHPGRMESFFSVNDRIKARDFWMPFAPTILDTAASRYLVNYNSKKSPAPHMITAFQASADGKKDLCAALHQGDHTLRPQVLESHVNPSYYKLIEEFQSLTGIGALLNTSLNLHGFPLVATIEQAMQTMENSSLDHMLMGPFLISKRSDGCPSHENLAP